MKLQRFYIGQRVSERKEITLTDLELINQLGKVFRFHTGDKVILFDGSGFEYEAEIIDLNKKEVNFRIISHSAKATRDKGVSLYLSLIKKGNFELAVEKCTEIGVTEIHPIVSERSEKKGLNLERLNKIVKEASEQSGRVTLPQVFDIVSLEEAVSQVIKEGKNVVVFHTVSNHLPSPTQDSSLEKAEKAEVATFVGPEGGFTDKEIELFKNSGFQISSLGSNILRAETAAMMAVWSQLDN